MVGEKMVLQLDVIGDTFKWSTEMYLNGQLVVDDRLKKIGRRKMICRHQIFRKKE
jgi:hypothetical protein